MYVVRDTKIPAELAAKAETLASEGKVDIRDVIVACMRWALRGRKWRDRMGGKAVAGDGLPMVVPGAARAAAVVPKVDHDWMARKRRDYALRHARLSAEKGRPATDAEVREDARARGGAGHWLLTEYPMGTPPEILP